MAVVKEEVLELIERMPDDWALADILYELYLKHKVGQGLQDIEEGRVKTHEEVKQNVSGWSR